MNGETAPLTLKSLAIKAAVTSLLLVQMIWPGTTLAQEQPQVPAPQAQKAQKTTFESYHADLLLFVKQKNPKLSTMTALASTKALVSGAKTMVKYHGRTVDDWLPLIVGVAKQESTFQPRATSPANARGIMQVHWPTWGRKLGGIGLDQDDLYNPVIGAQCGTAILAMYIRDANGSIPGALYKYYGTRDKNYAAGVLRGALEFEQFRKKISQETRQSLLAALQKSANG